MKKTILEDISVYSMKILIIDTSQKIGVAILYSQGLGSEKKKGIRFARATKSFN